MKRSCLCIMVSLICLVSCKNGGEEDFYPNVVTEFATIRTDAEGTMKELTTDDEHTYAIRNPQKGFKKDYSYRVVCGFVREGQAVTLYQLTAAYLLGDSTELAQEPDPIKVTSIWQSGKYINMHLSPLTQGGTQYWGYRIDETTSSSRLQPPCS